MTKAELSKIYRDYIACLNEQDWSNLGQFVQENVSYNDERIGWSGDVAPNVYPAFRRLGRLVWPIWPG